MPLRVAAVAETGAVTDKPEAPMTAPAELRVPVAVTC